MDRPVGPLLRWVRACLLAAVSVGLAVGAHASAGGAVPGAPALVVVLAVSAAAAAALLGRPASARRVAGLLLASQVLVHLWLTLATAPADHQDMAASTPGHEAMGPSMLLAHLAAAAGVGVWLALGERALWTVLGLAVGGVRDLLRHRRSARGGLPLVAPGALDLLRHGAAAVTERSVHLVRHQAVLRRSLARRGPPVLRST